MPDLTPDLLERVGFEIAHAMQTEGVNQVQLADRMGLGKAQVNQMVSGERNLTLRSLDQIADALGHDVEIKLVPRFRTKDA